MRHSALSKSLFLLCLLLLVPATVKCRCAENSTEVSNTSRSSRESEDGPIFLSPDGQEETSNGCNEEDSSGNETSQDSDGDGTISSMVRKRAKKVMAVMREAIRGVPQTLRHIPLLLGYFPGLKRTQEEVPASTPFPCVVDADAASSYSPPSSVHRLKPGDIRVVAAIGDSISSAHGAMAQSDENVRVSFRGISATGGGQETWRQFLTLPNILKVFNPNLKGYATASVPTSDPAAGLNLAENGALDEDILYQAKTLVGRIKNDPSIDFRRDWKLVNILVGGNDICNEYCFVSSDKDSPAGHRRMLEATLDFLRINLPRTFVNLIHVPNIIHLRDMKNIPLRCHIRRMILCSCLFGGSDKGKADSVAKMVEGYWEAERQVCIHLSTQASQPRFETDEFAVVLQPFFVGLEPPPLVETRFGMSPDLTYFAPDCFHFSQKGNAHMAYALWNNMLEPVGLKSTPKMDRYLRDFHCPSNKAPYIFTRKNSETFIKTGHQ